MVELILKCETKFKKLTWHAFISGCKTKVLHWIFIEFILIKILIPLDLGGLRSKWSLAFASTNLICGCMLFI